MKNATKEAVKEEKDTKGLTVKKNEDFSEWYTQVVQKAELADYAPIRGFMVIRPRAYALWEQIQAYFNNVLKAKGVENAYFPLLIPESFFKREAVHAHGFAPELAYLEGKDEGERLALRPTSETIIYDAYAKWIRSHRDLPLKMNQWCNIVRWEVKQTKPFLRTREFLWQEGHCVFASEEEAEANMHEIIEAYRALCEEMLAIPVLMGRKSKHETFAGAKKTMTIEALMPDGKALQCGTSHNLGQGFAKVFGIQYQGEDGKEHTPWQTSWGFSTRLIGAIAMVHGDERGLVIPPRVAHQKVVIVPIVFEESREKVMKAARAVQQELAALGAVLDEREYSPGWKFSEWEMKGIPLRVEIGPKDIEKKSVTLVRRDTGKKEQIAQKELMKKAEAILEDIQRSLFRKAEQFLKSSIASAASMQELVQQLAEKKIVKVALVDEPAVEEQLKEASDGAVSRIVEESSKDEKCIVTGKTTRTIAYVAKAY